jgi:1-acyl-sn-glycerol-3-phosphate acyltransferase
MHKESWLTPPFYWLCKVAMRFLLFLLASYEVRGQENVPRRGALILVSNHLNNTDPNMLAAAFPRRIIFMAKVELFRIAPAGFMLGLFGAFPVRRFEADLGALRTAARVLASGHVLGMFPEGHRTRTGGLQPAHPGTAMIALRSAAPLIPVAITGTEGVRGIRYILRHRPRIIITIGKPFFLPPCERVTAEAAAEATDLIMSEIAALLPPSYRGAYNRDEAAAPGALPATG